MKYYKILREDMTHHEFTYKTGLNVDTVPFDPTGWCKPGGLYFSRESILYFLSFGSYIAEVEIPEDAQVYEEVDGPCTKWKANKIILKERELITGKVIKRLIEEGAEPRISDDSPLWWANNYGTLDMVKALEEVGASLEDYEEEDEYDEDYEEEDYDEEGVGEFDGVEEDEVPDII